MMIDRTVQLQILEVLAKEYPSECDGYKAVGGPWEVFSANACYLRELGLCEFQVARSMQLGVVRFGLQKITAKGLDFLADDGGLGAILGVVTVRLHADTLRDIIASKVEQSDLPTEEKTTIKKRLAALSETGLREVTTALVRAGIRHAPDLIALIGTHVAL